MLGMDVLLVITARTVSCPGHVLPGRQDRVGMGRGIPCPDPGWGNRVVGYPVLVLAGGNMVGVGVPCPGLDGIPPSFSPLDRHTPVKTVPSPILQMRAVQIVESVAVVDAFMIGMIFTFFFQEIFSFLLINGHK